jgi:hypothetical protein
MSGIFPTYVLPSDLRALKSRINPQVTLIDAIVQRTPSLDAETRTQWQLFTAQWREFFAAGDAWRTAAQNDAGAAFERKLRDLKSVLSSQCFGVPAPAPKRDVSFLPTWVTPTLVREQKTRITPRVRELGLKVAQASALDETMRRAWVEFAGAWGAFEADEEGWTHCTAQYENALAFEDVLPEWDDTVSIAGAGLPQASPGTTAPPPYVNGPAPRPRGVAPGLPSPPAFAPSAPGGFGYAPPAPPSKGFGLVPVLVLGAAVVAGVVLLKRPATNE